MIDVRFREGIDRAVRPIGRVLVRAGFTANRLTLTGLFLNIVASAFLVTGRFALAFCFALVGNLLDMLDGAVAKAGQTTSRRGAFLDSVADRVSDAAMFGALAWYLMGVDRTLAAMAVAVLGLSLIISYERSRAESLGLDGKAGIFERGERLLVLGAGVIIPGVLRFAVYVLLVGTFFTAIQRFVFVWRQSEPAPAPSGVTPYRLGVAKLRRRAYREDLGEVTVEKEATVFTAFVPRRMRERLAERAQRRPPSAPRRKRARGA